MTDLHKWNPSPQVVEAILSRLGRFHALVYEVDLGDGIQRLVRIGQRLPLSNKQRPDLSMLMFVLEPLVLTPYLPEIRGVFYATALSLQKGIISWVPHESMAHLTGRRLRKGESKQVRFRSTTPQAELSLQRKFAKLTGMRYRSKRLIRQDQYEYTREP